MAVHHIIAITVILAVVLVAEAAGDLVTKVELRVSCTNLLDKDVMSKSDPLCQLSTLNGGRWNEVGRTERILNNLNPNFAKSITVDYHFEEVQKLKFAVFDIDSESQKLSGHDFLGEMEVTLGQIVSNKVYKAPLLLKNKVKAGKGTITITAEELSGPKEQVYLTFSGSNLDKKDFFGKSDPYLEIFRSTVDGSQMLIHKTEFIKNTLNPNWKPFKISMRSLCNDDPDMNLLFKIWDWDSDGSSDLIGQFTTTFREMSQAMSSRVKYHCINPKIKAKKKSYKDSGLLFLTKCITRKEYSFLDYVLGGCQIDFTVGVDFTGSNGDPRDPSSLHYMNPAQPNQYQLAIRSVGTVVQDYDTDKLFPALGFGARLPPNWQVSHEFALNFNPQNPYCAGIDGILAAYQNAVHQIQLYGPTNASPIINHVARIAAEAAQQPGASAYQVLLLLTDGVLSDMNAAREAIVRASHLPMSIIIVGIGSADFEDMEILDGDEVVLKSPSGEPVVRDIVQFVPFREFQNAHVAKLAKTVLEEVPSQVADYFNKKNIPPNNA